MARNMLNRTIYFASDKAIFTVQWSGRVENFDSADVKNFFASFRKKQ